MPVPTSINDLSTTAASNSPAGSDSIGNNADDYLRGIQAILKETGGTLYTAGGTGNAITVTTTPTTTSYTTGQRWLVKASASNTGAVTLNVNGLGTKTVKKSGGAALVSGDIISGDVYLFVYDGTDVKIVGSLGQYAITLGGALSTTHALTLTQSGSTSLTLPTSGTLAVLGANTFTGNQSLGQNALLDVKQLGWITTSAVNSGSAITVTLASQSHKKIVLNAATVTITIDYTGAVTGFTTLILKQDGAGSRAVNWVATNFGSWVGNDTTLNTNASGLTVVTIFYDADTGNAMSWQRIERIGVA